jgi:hypothetical protein
MNFPKTIILIAIIFPIPKSLSKFAPYFQNSRKKEIIVIISGPGTGKVLLSMAC